MHTIRVHPIRVHPIRVCASAMSNLDGADPSIYAVRNGLLIIRSHNSAHRRIAQTRWRHRANSSMSSYVSQAHRAHLRSITDISGPLHISQVYRNHRRVYSHIDRSECSESEKGKPSVRGFEIRSGYSMRDTAGEYYRGELLSPCLRPTIWVLCDVDRDVRSGTKEGGWLEELCQK